MMKNLFMLALTFFASRTFPKGLRRFAFGVAGLALASQAWADAPAEPTPRPPPEAAMQIVVTGVLDFGGCAVGSVRSEKITITNSGTQDVAVVVASAPEGFELRPAVFGLPAGESRELLLSFRPMGTNDYTGILRIKTGDQELAVQSVTGVGFLSEPGLLRSKKSTYDVSEGQPFVEMVIDRLKGMDGDVSVDFATHPGDTATPRADYEPMMGTVRWKQGDDLSKTFRIPIGDDRIYEGPENFMVELSNPKGGATIDGPTLIEVRIQDNDARGLR